MSKPSIHNEKMHEITLKRSSINLLDNIKTFYQAYKAFLKIQPDIIHSVTVKPNLIFGFIALLYRKPILITIPGLGAMFSEGDRRNKLVANLLIFLYRIVSLNKKSVFIFENKTDLGLFKNKQICSDLNGFTVPGSGVNIDEYKAEKLKASSSSELKLLFAARLLKGKGLYELVDVVSSLRKRNVNVSLDVAGIIDFDSKEAIPVEMLEQWANEGKINWLGQVNQGMVDVIVNNDVIVLPTRYGEGLPRILIEANACQRPVIATDIGGCKDFVIDGENGLIVKTSNPHELERAIIRLTDRAYCAQLGENGRKRVEEFYTDNHVISCYQSIYNN